MPTIIPYFLTSQDMSLPPPYNNTLRTQYGPTASVNAAAQAPQSISVVAPPTYHTQSSVERVVYPALQAHSQPFRTQFITPQQPVLYNPAQHQLPYRQPTTMVPAAQAPFQYGQQPVTMPVGLPSMQLVHPTVMMPTQMSQPQIRDLSGRLFPVVLPYQQPLVGPPGHNDEVTVSLTAYPDLPYAIQFLGTNGLKREWGLNLLKLGMPKENYTVYSSQPNSPGNIFIKAVDFENPKNRVTQKMRWNSFVY